MWWELGKRAPIDRREAVDVLCRSCVRLRCDLQHQMNRTLAESLSKKLKRQNASSHARLNYMSPESQKERKRQQKIQRDSYIEGISVMLIELMYHWTVSKTVRCVK